MVEDRLREEAVAFSVVRKLFIEKSLLSFNCG